ncbi:MAG: ABC transporter permease [Bacteroidota bacterium]|nr:ABC transporter permease [Bacteroidota bacterium]
MSLSITLRSELLKTKRTAAFYFTLIGAAAVPVIFLLNALLDSDDMDATRKDPLNGLFKLLSEMNGYAFFPWFIILISTLLPQIEYKNNTWKQVLTSPQTKADLLLAKFLNIHFLMLLFLVSTHLFMFIAIIIANVAVPAIGFFDHSLDGGIVLTNAANAYVTMLAVCTIQFWIGLRFKNFIVPIAVGLALWLTGTILVLQFNSGMAKYFPYSFQVFNVSSKHHTYLNQVAWTSAGYAVFFLFACFLDFRRREIIK